MNHVIQDPSNPKEFHIIHGSNAGISLVVEQGHELTRARSENRQWDAMYQEVYTQRDRYKAEVERLRSVISATAAALEREFSFFTVAQELRDQLDPGGISRGETPLFGEEIA